MLNILTINHPEQPNKLFQYLADSPQASHVIPANFHDDWQQTISLKQPDIVLIHAPQADTYLLKQLTTLLQAQSLPVVVFVDQSTQAMTQSIMQLDVAAYIIDGLSMERLTDIITIALARFNNLTQLKQELQLYKQNLADRKDIEKAKGLLMESLDLSEEDAYQHLRKAAMNHSQTMAQTARSLIQSMAMLQI